MPNRSETQDHKLLTEGRTNMWPEEEQTYGQTTLCCVLCCLDLTPGTQGYGSMEPFYTL